MEQFSTMIQVAGSSPADRTERRNVAPQQLSNAARGVLPLHVKRSNSPCLRYWQRFSKWRLRLERSGFAEWLGMS